MWDDVATDQQNGIITSYTITYQSQTENDNERAQVNSSSLQTELTNLKEYVNYNITVFASTVKGDGPASDLIVVRTDQDSKKYFLSRFLLYVLVIPQLVEFPIKLSFWLLWLFFIHAMGICYFENRPG